jgi:chaperonin cofactor prefoldin
MVMHANEREEMAKGLEEWKELEDKTMRLAQDLHSKTDNAFIKVNMEMIRHDSEKHKAMLEYAINTLTKESSYLRQEELIPLSDVLESQINAKAKSITLATSCLNKDTDMLVKFVVSNLLADEVKHHEMLSRLDSVRAGIYSYVGEPKFERIGAPGAPISP